MEFCFFEKVHNSIAKNLSVTLLNDCRKIGDILKSIHISMTELYSAFLYVKINTQLVEKLMHSFEVHSNESMCRKSGRLGLDQDVILQTGFMLIYYLDHKSS